MIWKVEKPGSWTSHFIEGLAKVLDGLVQAFTGGRCRSMFQIAVTYAVVTVELDQEKQQ